MKFVKHRIGKVIAKLKASLKKADAFQMRICNPSYFKQNDKIEIVKMNF